MVMLLTHLTFYQVSLKIGISGSMGYGRNTYDFKEGTLTFIKPNQVVKVENAEERYKEVPVGHYSSTLTSFVNLN